MNLRVFFLCTLDSCLVWEATRSLLLFNVGREEGELCFWLAHMKSTFSCACTSSLNCEGPFRFLLNLHQVESDEGGSCTLRVLWSWGSVSG